MLIRAHPIYPWVMCVVKRDADCIIPLSYVQLADEVMPERWPHNKRAPVKRKTRT